MKRKVEVLDYSEAWKLEYKKYEQELLEILSESIIHHIGSTSIEGMPAKPIIDLLCEVDKLERVDALNERFVEKGYIPMGEYGILGRRFFIKGTIQERFAHVHIFEEGDANIIRHIKFRDYMRRNPSKAKEYGELKKKLAFEHTFDIESYINGKDSFIKGIDKEILENGD